MRHRKMRYAFLIGSLCGAMMAAGVTFALAIPANNEHWRVEITKHGGGDWSIDKEGNFHWSWSVPPVSERDHSAPVIIVPRAQPSSDSSSLERL